LAPACAVLAPSWLLARKAGLSLGACNLLQTLDPCGLADDGASLIIGTSTYF
jgi:hypothetical protein